MYSNALEVGIYPSEFWDMSVQEVKDTVNSRHKQKQNDIYALSAMVRVAVLSAFSKDVKFPEPPNEEHKGDWKNSYNYMKALQKLKKGGAK
jgi:hypothetical protein